MKTWTAALALMSCLALTGCGSGALSGPGSSSDDAVSGDSSSSSSSSSDGRFTSGDGGGGGVAAGSGEEQPGSTGGPTRKTRYDFTLPVGETAVDVNEGDVYKALSEGRCDDAQALLDEKRGSFRSERTVPLFEAGVHLCRGDVAAAKAAYKRAVYENESKVWFICALDRAVGSVVRQRPKSAFGGCPPVVELGSTPEPESSTETSPETSPESSPESSEESSPEASSSPSPSPDSSPESSPDTESSSDTTESSSESSSESAPDAGSTADE
ncbi:hypothetical protein [Nonomuraea gerenzanensis]|uniref:hypothetical protein n=1 Tax=Nonomuraea gerenzanensis TaxID=93944 RepID=UPI001CD9C8B5|nr:hypothetical protein [Nonomuraea gerenzanensis]UBU16092.1 hypothetical protein LCN96_14095 [Nonomuraea gerenzanensis]